MKKLQTLFTLSLIAFFALPMFSQSLYPAIEAFSYKKTAYITLQNGEMVEGQLNKVKRKKGLIKEVWLKDENGEKTTYLPEDIQHMYLPANALAKFGAELEAATDIQQWDNDDLDQSRIDSGYVYIEQSEVQFKKKKMTLLLQLLNPHFSSKIKVYNDPFAGETASVGVGGFTVAGGLDKSYYVKKGDASAEKLTKKEYKKQFADFYKDCKSFMKSFDKPKWADFPQHIYDYTQECEE